MRTVKPQLVTYMGTCEKQLFVLKTQRCLAVNSGLVRISKEHLHTQTKN